MIRIIAALEERYSKEKGIKVFKGKEELRVLDEILSFSPVPEIFIVNPKKSKKINLILQKNKKRLGRIEISKINTKLDDTLILFDKAIIYSTGKLEFFN